MINIKKRDYTCFLLSKFTSLYFTIFIIYLFLCVMATPVSSCILSKLLGVSGGLLFFIILLFHFLLLLLLVATERLGAAIMVIILITIKYLGRETNPVNCSVIIFLFHYYIFFGILFPSLVILFRFFLLLSPSLTLPFFCIARVLLPLCLCFVMLAFIHLFLFILYFQLFFLSLQFRFYLLWGASQFSFFSPLHRYTLSFLI